jgi:hypothetical protein
LPRDLLIANRLIMFIFIAAMKRCLIILICFCGLFNKVWGQSPSAAIDTLVKYRIITTKDRLVLEQGLKDKGYSSYRSKILWGLEKLMLEKKFHVNLHKTGVMYSFAFDDGHLKKKNQDSINTVLRTLLDKIKKAGLLTDDRVYTHALQGIDTGRYVIEMQMVGALAEMSSRLEQLTPNKLLPLAQDLHKNGIVVDSAFVRLKNDIENGKIESAFQLNGYCKLDKVFDLAKYPDDPDVWLERIHHDIASIVPGLNFTNFSYTAIPDTSFSIPGVKFKVSLVCNGRIYKHISLPINNYKKGQAEISPKDIFTTDFYRIFNKILTDQQSPLRLHSIMFSPGTATDNNFRHLALIALNEEQARAFMKETNLLYMFVSMDNYDPALTTAKIDSTITGCRKIGLFTHLSNAEIDKAIDDANATDLFSINGLLVNFPGVVYPLNPVSMSSQYPYITLLSHFSQITHGAFNPTKISQRKAKGGVTLQYSYKGKTHYYTFNTANGWLDAKFPMFMKHLNEENNLTGKFYLLQYEDTVIYLTKQQHDYAAKYNLLSFIATP